METEVIEQVAFPTSIPITKFDASVIAPFFPPLMRGTVVVNTEKDKNLDVQPVPGKITWFLFGVKRMARSEVLNIGHGQKEQWQNTRPSSGTVSSVQISVWA